MKVKCSAVQYFGGVNMNAEAGDSNALPGSATNITSWGRQEGSFNISDFALPPPVK